MADCVLRSMSLLFIFILKSPVYSEWSFTVRDNDLVYSLSGCNCTEFNCSSSLSTTSTPLNTTNIQPPISYQSCSCLNKTRECLNSTNTTSLSNISTVCVHDIHNSTLDRCSIFQLGSPCSNNSAIPEWVIQVNDTNIILEETFSNFINSKFNCSIDGAGLNVDSISDNTTGPSTPTNVTTRTTTPTTPATTTTTAASATNTTGLVIIAVIAGVNIVLGIGVCAFILCKRRQISVNYRKQQKVIKNAQTVIKNFSEATSTATRTNMNNIEDGERDTGFMTTRAARANRNSIIEVDPDNTLVKTRAARVNRNSIIEVDPDNTLVKTQDRDRTFVKRLV